MKLTNKAGLSVEVLETGDIRCIDAGPVRISMRAGTPYSIAGATLFLRKRMPGMPFTALTGPGSNSRFRTGENFLAAEGHWDGLDYACALVLAEDSLQWQWQVEIINNTNLYINIDLLYTQDTGLKEISGGLTNEHYVSQYLERLVIEDQQYGAVAFCRQNMKEAGGHPWLMLACGNGAVAAATDGMQFYGSRFRETGVPEGLLSDRLGGEYAGESALLALQERARSLGPGERHRSVFYALYQPDHPGATSGNDLSLLETLTPFSAEVPLSAAAAAFHGPDLNLFNTAPFLPVDDLDEAELERHFGTERRHAGIKDGKLLSFFYGQQRHVVLREKEVLVDRPHAHIMQAGRGLSPDESIMSTTAFAFGVFNSHLTQGNTNFNTLLSICTSPFNLAPETGQRIFVKKAGRWYLLGVPSAFEMGLQHCRWIYQSGEHCFLVRTWTSAGHPQVNMDFSVIAGPAVSLLITHDFDALNGWSVREGGKKDEYVALPAEGSMIAGKFPRARFRLLVQGGHHEYRAGGEEALHTGPKVPGDSLFVLEIQETMSFCLSFVGEAGKGATPVAIENPDEQWETDCLSADRDWRELGLDLSLEGAPAGVAAIREILPWYGMNALVHYLTPYGLEQFSGAAWGTRDIAQGPFDLLLASEKYDAAKQLLRTLFSNQHPDGGWPQWWMFDSYASVRADSAHGDVVYWCMIALSRYVRVTGDAGILDEVLPYYREKGPAEQTPLMEHLDRLVRFVVSSFLHGTAMVPFGGGDWNDSLQPVSKALARRMISAWTVEMNYQAFHEFAVVCEMLGDNLRAGVLRNHCERIRADFNRHLVRDGIVAGYGLAGDDGGIALLLHPTDAITGIHYSLLPMNRGIISGIFTPEQAALHQETIESHLKGPDGARLMDRPLEYRGGVQTLFRRAESSTFFGREIGLMYVHEHLRYAESLAITGKAEAFVHALRQANPVAYGDIVPCGDLRQSNCYYSSSDVIFRNRYEADELYGELIRGNLLLKGGWRVYSSGPGIYLGLVVNRLLGLRRESGNCIFDPVMPLSFDGLSVSFRLMDRPVRLNYAVREGYFGPGRITVNGTPAGFSREENPYRKGGALIPAGQLVALLNRQDNVIDILL